ncbi:MAG: hypothetical protein ACI9FD_004964, partial [Gammaproteobacteria bacterium]
GAMRKRLAELKTEHRDLDQALDALQQATYVDQLQIRRLKKRKLQLKDTIIYIQGALIHDEPA